MKKIFLFIVLMGFISSSTASISCSTHSDSKQDNDDKTVAGKIKSDFEKGNEYLDECEKYVDCGYDTIW
ncbi:hypothetical protein EDL79_03475 [Ehrlichia ruminantium]|uniref:Lipoprotein n=1 Tax=Ehrlichia ruminantium TaxID=779 RepID=A0AAE6QDJ9_EHRRU|nr:hypothetical protein [Ehrlichia ruminantium]QGR02684.1 hypothetical protein EDL81_03460 [Ehrlichia ruminantium]QGR03605.1 hypothetical protein EDL80_03465 [Ehrlichia ruminantium]QGR04532.1 hypothetical protein EDL79_03475 [Ehrlichia ruminantium]